MRKFSVARAMRHYSTILLVEDYAPLRQTLTRLLTRRGFVVLAGTSGQEGLSLFVSVRESPIGNTPDQEQDSWFESTPGRQTIYNQSVA
jgi:hypothetical protein